MNPHEIVESATILLRICDIEGFEIKHDYIHRNSYIVLLDDQNDILRCQKLINKWRPTIPNKNMSWHFFVRPKPSTDYRTPWQSSIMSDVNKGGKKFKKAKKRAAAKKRAEERAQWLARRRV
jgi:hypothetical protein